MNVIIDNVNSLTLKYPNSLGGVTTTDIYYGGIYKAIPYFFSGDKTIVIAFWNDEIIVNENGSLNELFSEINLRYSKAGL